MATHVQKRIIVLPFISNKKSVEITEMEHLIVQGLEYKLFPINAVKLLDLKIKHDVNTIKPEGNSYSLSALRVFAEKSSAEYALVGRFDDNEDGITTKAFFEFFDLISFVSIIAWETQDDCFTYLSDNDFNINVSLFSDFINDSSFNIVDNLGLDLDYVVNQYLEEEFVSNITSYRDLVKAKKVVKSTDEKLKLLNNAIKITPAFELPYFERAKIQKNRRNYQEAIDDLNIAIENASSDYHKAYYLTEMGSCYALSKEYPKGVECWEKAIGYYPSYINPYMSIALAYEESGDYEKSEESFLEIQNLAPQDCRTYFSLARLYSKKADWLKAIEQYQQLLKFQPNDAWSYSNIGNCYLQLGKNKEAKTFFYKTIELDPDGEAGSYASQVIKALDEASKKDWWKFWRR